MKTDDSIITGSILLLFLGAYLETTILSVIAVGAFFYQLGKRVGADEQRKKVQEMNNLSAKSQLVSSEDG